MRNWNAVYGNTKVFQIYWFDQYLAAFPEKQKNSRTSIKAIIRPKGEAGNRKRGFILYDAMEMNKLENGPVLYDRMRVSVDSKLFWATYMIFQSRVLGFSSKSLCEGGLRLWSSL